MWFMFHGDFSTQRPGHHAKRNWDGSWCHAEISMLSFHPLKLPWKMKTWEYWTHLNTSNTNKLWYYGSCHPQVTSEPSTPLESDHINVDLDNTMDLERLNKPLLESLEVKYLSGYDMYMYIYIYRYMYICLLMLRMFVSPPFQSSLFPLSSTSAYPWEKFVSYIIMMDLISACRRAPWDPYGSQTKMLPGASKWMQKQSNSSPTWETQCDTNYVYIYIIKYMVLWGSMCTMQVVQKLAYT